MRILVAGKSGQIGYELERSLQGLGRIIALDRDELDLANPAQIRQVIQTVKPNLIVNAAAYTAVDKAESEPDLAMRVNGEAPAVMAEEAVKLGAAIVHYSTDYVFDGTKGAPYTEHDTPAPINQYGLSKLAGEQAVLASSAPHFVLRTSWIYGTRGKNFFKTMLRLAGEKNELTIVDDQTGAPTWCRSVADATARMVAKLLALSAPGAQANVDDLPMDSEVWGRHSGLYHVTAAGATTWHGFAKAILEHPSVAKCPVLIPIGTEAFPTPARRPAYSVLSSARFSAAFGSLPDWQTGLRLCRE